MKTMSLQNKSFAPMIAYPLDILPELKLVSNFQTMHRSSEPAILQNNNIIQKLFLERREIPES